jgi:hypothetical protein
LAHGGAGDLADEIMRQLASGLQMGQYGFGLTHGLALLSQSVQACVVSG